MTPTKNKPQLEITIVLEDLQKEEYDLKNLIRMLILTGMEIRIGSDGYCLIIQGNSPDTNDGFDWVAENEVVINNKYVNWAEFNKDEKENYSK